MSKSKNNPIILEYENNDLRVVFLSKQILEGWIPCEMMELFFHFRFLNLVCQRCHSNQNPL